MSVTIEQDIKEVLGEINQKLENINRIHRLYYRLRNRYLKVNL